MKKWMCLGGFALGRSTNTEARWRKASTMTFLVACPLLASACGASAPDDESLGALSSELRRPGGVSVDTSSTSGFLGAVGNFTFPQCTGTLIGRDLVLTAAHCLDCEPLPTPANPRMTFAAGPLGDTVKTQLIGWTAHPQSNACGWGGQIPVGQTFSDLAVAKLKDPVPTAQSADVVPVFLDDPKYLDRSTAVTVGMSTGFKQYTAVSPTGNWSQSLSSNLFDHGDSGGPLLMNDIRTGQPTLVGVISAQVSGEQAIWASTIGQADFIADAIGFPASVSLKDVAVMGGTVKLNDRVRVARTALSPPTIVVAGLGVELGADARVEGNIAARGNVNLRSRAKVVGNVLTRGVVTPQQGASVTGTTTDGTYVKLPAVPASGPPVSVFNGAQDIWINSGQPCQPISTGIYGEVHLSPQTHCTMKAGIYFIRNLYVDSGATLDVALDSTLPTVISTGSFVLRGQMNSWVNNLVTIVWGQGTTFLQTSYSGTLIQLNAGLVLASTSYFGAFFAPNIEVHQGATIAQVPTVTGIFN